MIFHNLRLIHRMKKPAYVKPCIGWNDEDFKVGLRKFGVAELPGAYQGKDQGTYAPT